MLGESLTACGWECELASSGKAALDLLKNSTFEVLVTEIVMPGMDGFDLTDRVKRQYLTVLVIMMTGFSEDDSYGRAVAAGTSDFIKKPFTITN
jgi:DNA-binding response OmpR family regulator